MVGLNCHFLPLSEQCHFERNIGNGYLLNLGNVVGKTDFVLRSGMQWIVLREVNDKLSAKWEFNVWNRMRKYANWPLPLVLPIVKITAVHSWTQCCFSTFDVSCLSCSLDVFNHCFEYFIWFALMVICKEIPLHLNLGFPYSEVMVLVPDSIGKKCTLLLPTDPGLIVGCIACSRMGEKMAFKFLIIRRNMMYEMGLDIA